MTERCQDCPVSGDRECLAVLDPARFGHFCRWASRPRPMDLEAIRGRARIGIDPPAPEAQAPSRAITNEPIPYSPAQLLILECDYRFRPEGCSCNSPELCALKKGSMADSPFEVSYSDCLNCVTAT